MVVQIAAALALFSLSGPAEAHLKAGEATVQSNPPTVFDLGSGQNVIIRVGLAFGLGG